MNDIPFFVFLGIIYAVVIGGGSWLVMHAERRKAWQLKLQTALSGAGGWLDARRTGFTHKVMGLPARLLSALQHTKAAILRKRRVLLFVLILLAAPALVLHLLAPDALEAYSDLPQTTDPVIMALLQGEQLVPPPPLPPAAFTTREIEAERHELITASREWNALDADFRQRLLTVYRLMEKHGYRMALLEGYRSPERQAQLARLGPHVTRAGAYQSYHQYGLAADSAFYRDGRIVISEKDPWAMEGYRLYGQYAESVGLNWGGRWQLMDFGHVELRKARHAIHP